MSSDFLYRSIHDYLDQVFKGIEPSEQQIFEAKKTYWKTYNTDLKRRRRKKIHEFLVGFTDSEIRAIRLSMYPETAVSRFIRAVVLQSPLEVQSEKSQKIEQKLFLIVNYLEEILDSLQLTTAKMESMHQMISALQILLNDYQK